MGKTFAEQFFSYKTGSDMKAGQVAIISPDYCLSHDNAASIIKTFNSMTDEIWDPNRIVITFDHTVPASTDGYAEAHKTVREFVKKHHISHFYDMNCHGGICHQIMCQEAYAAPGRLIIGTDSHTCTSGAMGAFATGIGRSEMASIWACGEIWLQVPESIRINLKGSFRPGVYAKDLVLYLVGQIGAGGASYKCLEFHGEAASKLSVSERMTICNMAVEMDAKAAVFKPDEKVFSILKQAGQTDYHPIWADDDATYAQTIDVDLSEIVPCVATPGRVDNYSAVSSLKGVPIHQAVIGSCTNGRLQDLRIAADTVRGKHVAVRTIIFPASCKVLEDALHEGIISDLVAAGCTIMPPGCGACVGTHGGILTNGETCISSTNRNFNGRMGSKEAKLYLASPATVAASALQGVISAPALWKGE